MNPESKIFVAGHTGMAGSAIVRNLQAKGFRHLVTREHQALDLTRQSDVEDFFVRERPEYVFLAAAKVGGILANSTYPAEFIYQNLAIATHVIDAAHHHGVKRLLFLGSSCIYPKHCPQPMREEHLLNGALEPTNEPYAIAKIAGLKMCDAYNRQYGARFLCAMPTNLYGVGDNFNLETSHVLPALIRKFHEGLENGHDVVVWGTGRAERELLYVDDCAEACVALMNMPPDSFEELLQFQAGPLINVGTGKGMTIRVLVEIIRRTTGFKGGIQWDTTKPDGTMKKVLDVSRLHALGWNAKISLEEGIAKTYAWYRHSLSNSMERESVVPSTS